MTKRIAIAAFSYLIPTFATGFVWHLVAFKGYYEALAMYRKDVIIPFGFLSMSIQAVLFAWVFLRVFAQRPDMKSRVIGYTAFGAALSWSFTTLAVGAKNVMSSVPDYLLIESCYTLVQWSLVGPLTVLLLRGIRPLEAAHA